MNIEPLSRFLWALGRLCPKTRRVYLQGRAPQGIEALEATLRKAHRMTRLTMVPRTRSRAEWMAQKKEPNFIFAAAMGLPTKLKAHEPRK